MNARVLEEFYRRHLHKVILDKIKKKNVMNYLLEAIYYRSRLYNPILCERNDIPHKK